MEITTISAQKPIQLILARQLASSLAMPIMIVDTEGAIICWNEPAKLLLGMRFEETGEIPASIWREQFSLRDVDQSPIPHDQWPLVIALTQHLPLSRTLCVGAPDGRWRQVHWTSLPFTTQGGEFLGLQSVFWDV